MQPLINALIATFLVSAISLVGVFFLVFKHAVLQKILLFLVGFSAGAMMGGAFLHLVPEALNELDISRIGIGLILGFSVFFILERILHWHHCHKNDGKCEVHIFAYTNLIGDGLHNILDGLVIAAAFVASPALGITTTIAVILHEIPQEISDFGVLLYAGLSKPKALFFNFISALLAMLGAVLGFFLAGTVTPLTPWLLVIAAGGFLYISASDLIPELHKEKNLAKSLLSFGIFLLGVALMWIFKIFFA